MTKERIARAARHLMAARGWTATTIQAIAAEAGVATPTVYAAFGSKLAILDALRSMMLEESTIPALMAEAADEPDPQRRLRLWATIVRRQMETSYDVIAIHREAARSDPESATAYRKVLDGRAKAFLSFVRGIGDSLPDVMDERSATDLLWAFSNEGLWSELVVERGWTPERFEQWLGDTLVAQLLTAPVATRSTRSSGKGR